MLAIDGMAVFGSGYIYHYQFWVNRKEHRARYLPNICLIYINIRWAATAAVRYKCYIDGGNFVTHWIKKLHSFYSRKKHIFGMTVWYYGTIEWKHVQTINRLCRVLLYYVYVMANSCHLIAWSISYAINVLCVWHMPLDLHYLLIHWDRDKMDDTLKTSFSNAFSWMKFMHFD